MCPRENSGISIRDPGTEHELLDHVREQYLSLKEEMAAKEQARIVQAQKFEEQLEDQRNMLTEIRNLVLRLSEERQKDERTDANV